MKLDVEKRKNRTTDGKEVNEEGVDRWERVSDGVYHVREDRERRGKLGDGRSGGGWVMADGHGSIGVQ